MADTSSVLGEIATEAGIERNYVPDRRRQTS